MGPTPRDILEKAGWSPARRIAIAPLIDRYLTLGYPVFPSLRKFLESFYGLVLTSEARAEVVRFELHPVQQQTDAEYCEEYARELRLPVAPVGATPDVVVLIDANGRFWASLDLIYGHLGDDIEQAIRSLLIDPPRLFDRRLPN